MGPASVDAALRAELEALFAAVPAFSFRLGFARRFGQAVLYLAPEPDAPFRDLTNRVCDRFPGHPPYGGAFEDVIPHLTVVHCQEPGVCDDVTLDVVENDVATRLPIEGRADEVWLMVGDDRWRVEQVFPLGRPGGSSLSSPPAGRDVPPPEFLR